jgi:very-short-patch-repair endonuclease
MRGKHRDHRKSRDARDLFAPSVGEIERLARRQHALVTRRQLLDLGMDGHAIDRRLRSRRLVRVRRGVYRLGPIAQGWEPEMSAVLTVGENAVLSHHSAAFLYQLLPHPARPAFIHVTVTGSDRGRKPGIKLHRASELPPDEITYRQRIPVTTPARTLLDLAAGLDSSALEGALARAHQRRLATPRAIQTLVARYPRRPGTPGLKAILDGPRPARFSRSDSERRLLAALRRAELPEPETNAPLAGYEIDFLWPSQRVVVEVDGHPFHSARPDRKRDLARDARLTELGYTVLRLDADVSVERAVGLVAGTLVRATR